MIFRLYARCEASRADCAALPAAVHQGRGAWITRRRLRAIGAAGCGATFAAALGLEDALGLAFGFAADFGAVAGFCAAAGLAAAQGASWIVFGEIISPPLRPDGLYLHKELAAVRA